MMSLVLEFLGVEELSLLSIRAGQSLVDLGSHCFVTVNAMHYHPEAFQCQATVNCLFHCSCESLEQIGHDLIWNAENLQIPQLIPETIRNTGKALETFDGLAGMGVLPRPGLGESVATAQSHLRSAFRLAISARKVRLLFRQILPEIWAVGLPRLLAIQTEDAARPLHTDVHQQVEEVVEHNEPPAFRDPELLREQEEHDWADRVVHRILCPQPIENEAESENEHEVVWIWPFKRTPKEFTEALLYGPELQVVREEMEYHGCPCVLPHGAKIFVRPHQYQEVLDKLLGKVLKASHLIIMDSLKPSLEEIMGRLPSKLKCKVHEDAVECFSLNQPHDSQHEGGEDWIRVEELLAVEKTFLCKVRRFKRLNEVSQSTRDSRKGTNPRCYELSSDFS